MKFERRLSPKETLVKLWREAIFGHERTLAVRYMNGSEVPYIAIHNGLFTLTSCWGQLATAGNRPPKGADYHEIDEPRNYGISVGPCIAAGQIVKESSLPTADSMTHKAECQHNPHR